MHLIGRLNIKSEQRQRSELKRDESLRQLRDSIHKSGLLHPIVLAPETFRLIAGGRRLAAIDWLWEEQKTFKCNNEDIGIGIIPFTYSFEEAERLQREYAEFAENEYRLNLPWLDRNAALMRIHELEQTLNPTQTLKATAEKLAAVAPQRTVESMAVAMMRAKKIVQHIADPAIKFARNENEAYSLAIRKEEAQIHALIAKQSTTFSADIKLIEGDLREHMPKLESSIADLLIADPPYGISAGDTGFKNRTVHHHNYEDTPDSARNLIRIILSEGFRISRSRANLFIFCDIGLWSWLSEAAEQTGWTRFRTPIIWAKSESEGMAPWGGQGFRRTYELIFFATKGQRGLLHSPVDILRHARVGRADRDYAAAKPISLLKELIACSTLPGETILDPCCGSGAALLAAKELKRAAIGIELDNNACNLTMAKLAGEISNEQAPTPSAADL